MGIIYCPVCNKRICDSNKHIETAKLSKNNESKADIVLKCSNCKNCISIKIPKDEVAV